MTPNGWLQITLYLVVLLLAAKPLGSFMAHVYEGERTFLDPIVRPFERIIYRLCGVRPGDEMDWKTYTLAFLLFSFLSVLAVYAMQRLQWLLPLNPAGMGAPTADLSWNTAVSFATNTNWQSYGGETTLSYLTQMAALTVQNFASAAAGMAVLVAFIRGFARHTAQTLGNFWVDLTRGTFYVLLPMSIILALVLVSQGVVQTLNPYQTATLVQPTTYQSAKLDAAGNPLKDASGNAVMDTLPLTEQMDGVEVTRRLREWTQVPIVVVSVRNAERDKVAALDAGADDYLTKPFSSGELLARLRAALRRATQPASASVFIYDDLSVDLSRRLVTIAGREAQLTPKEYDLLRVLVTHAGKVITHRQLLREVWGAGYEPELHMLHVNISNLRRKLEPDSSRPHYLVTEPGVGYRLRSD